MHLTLSPQRAEQKLHLQRQGDVLTINGTEYDFTQLPEGATLSRAAVDCDWLASDVERVGGMLHLTLVLPHGGSASPETLFPIPIINPPDGPVILPPYTDAREASENGD